jgi:predicted site-specific integrase-resolvase
MNLRATYDLVVATHDRISREDAAATLGVTVLTLDRYLKAGLISREKNPITRRVWLSRREVEKFRAARDGEDK